MERYLERYDDHASCGMGMLLKVSLASHKPGTLKVWVLSLYAYSKLESHLDDMADVVTHIKMVTIHKNIKQKLDTCMDPLVSAAHLSGVGKVISGYNGFIRSNSK